MTRPEQPLVNVRKKDQLRVCLNEDVEAHHITAGFDRYSFVHQGLPEVNAADIDLSLNLLGKKLAAPIIISSMTGGTEEAGAINRNLALAAQRLGVAMGVGSQRGGVENPSLAHTYQVRDVAPDILLLANLGAVQLNYGYSMKQCRQAVEMIGADALVLHLNPLQEALQTGGETNFGGLLAKIERICDELPVPVIVKEVGCGICLQAAEKLAAAGVAAIDVAGAGGTVWSEVEALCVDTDLARNVARAFASWGIPTAEAIKTVAGGIREVPCIGSGGIRTGVDAAKAIALGAAAVGIAGPVLRMAAISAEAVVAYLSEVKEELRLALFCLGKTRLEQLRGTPLLVKRE
ncbi:MAG: type 2 isopentenyl-diphosphate Delta-isomerase [Chloroflexi bacterium]|nr:type 2 isopentenyl-diphosphate Delta-isomerase [Chloroflexota bacterium]